jgi:hypothetical protein
MLLGETTYITTDVAAMPLLWTLPLAIYLLTFILVFAKKPPIPHAAMVRALPLLVTITLLLLLAEAKEPLPAILVLHFATLFVASMACHGELARLRPPSHELTGFYLRMSLGGALGGTFNALVAPLIFQRIVEYPLALVVVCACMPRGEAAQTARSRRLDLVIPALVGVLATALVVGVQGIKTHRIELAAAAIFGPPLLLNYASSRRPIRFALGLGAMVAVTLTFYRGIHGRTLHAERSFFGALRVAVDPEGKWVQLVNGNTVHGGQWIAPERRREPLLYYTRSGPVPAIFDFYRGQRTVSRMAVVGLGTGGLAPYARSGETWDYYELDPNVERLARDTRYFTYLDDFPKDAKVSVVLGDARRMLAEVPDNTYGLIVLDAFSSDSVPVHLLTREALALYRAKATSDGILAFHVSNRYLDVLSVVSALAREAGLPAACRRHQSGVSELAQGTTATEWCVMGAQPSVPIDRILTNDAGVVTAWHPAESGGARAWTDDYSSLLGLFRW